MTAYSCAMFLSSQNYKVKHQGVRFVKKLLHRNASFYAPYIRTDMLHADATS